MAKDPEIGAIYRDAYSDAYRKVNEMPLNKRTVKIAEILPDGLIRVEVLTGEDGFPVQVRHDSVATSRALKSEYVLLSEPGEGAV